MNHKLRANLPDQVKQHVQALCDLSDIKAGEFTSDHILSLSETAPDPETMIRQISGHISTSSEALMRKWRETLTNMWAHHHPEVPLLLDLPITSQEAANVPALQDALHYLAALAEKPARLVEEHGEVLLHPEEIVRLASVVPSLSNESIFALENEWGLQPIRRLRATLQTARLIRPFRGELVVVRSRYERFLKFPPVQQFYVLWHADTYHVHWGDFAGQWGGYLRLVQDYLPLLWDVSSEATVFSTDAHHTWCARVMDVFEPLWIEQGLINNREEPSQLLNIFQQSTLPLILDKILLCDLLAKYGLVMFTDDATYAERELHPDLSSGEFAWTPLGAAMLQAERSTTLPCGLNLLD